MGPKELRSANERARTETSKNQTMGAVTKTTTVLRSLLPEANKLFAAIVSFRRCRHHKPQSNADWSGLLNPKKHPEISDRATTHNTRRKKSSAEPSGSSQRTDSLLRVMLMRSIGSGRKPMMNLRMLAKQKKPHEFRNQHFPKGTCSCASPRCAYGASAWAKIEKRLPRTATIPPTMQARMAVLAAAIDRLVLVFPLATSSAMIEADAATATAPV